MKKEPQSLGVTNFSKAMVVTFAIFGFFASIATIYDVFGKKDSRLVARSYPSTPKVPYFLYSQIGPGFEENGRTFIDLLDEPCQQLQGRGANVVNTSDQSPPKVGDHYCRHTKDLKYLSKRMEDAYAFRGTVFEIELENEGSVAAKGIEIPVSGIEFMDVFSNGRRVNITFDEDSGDYKLPDLNPGKIYRIVIWKAGVPYSHSNNYNFDKIDISYSGQKVEHENFKYVNQAYWEYIEVFFDMGPIIGTLVFIFLGSAAGLAIIAFISLIVGLSQGKTVKEIFATPEKETI